jgi:hypothetical protein
MDVADSLELERVAAAARDALTDEIVARVAQTAADGLDLVDRANRAGLARALPALAALVDTGDLDRLVALARTYGAAQDALTDEMVARLADTVGGALALLDRLERAGVVELIARLDALAQSGALGRLDDLVRRFNQALDLVERVDGALRAAELTSAGGAGLGGLWQLLREQDTQDSLRYVLALGRGLRRR